MDNQQGPTVHPGTSAQCYLDRRGVWGRMDSCACMTESLRCAPETITTVITGYTPVQNKKLKKIKKCLKKREMMR